MAGNGAIKFLRGTTTAVSNNSSATLLDGQPLYITNQNQLVIGGGNSNALTKAPISCRELIGYASNTSTTESYSIKYTGNAFQFKQGSYTLSFPTLTANKTVALSDHTHGQYVPNTGASTIAGLKTFSSGITLATGINGNAVQLTDAYIGIDRGATGTIDYHVGYPNKGGTIALTDDIPTFSYSGTTLTITTS